MSITEKYCTTTGAGAHDGSSEANAWSLTEALSNAAAGQRVNVKKGTYTLAANFAPTNAGTVSQPMIWRGYNSTIGDLDITAVLNQKTLEIDATNMPLFDGGSSWAVIPTAHMIFEAIAVTQSGDRRSFQINNTNIMAYLCKLECSGNSANQAAVAIASAGGALCFCECNQTNTGGSSFGAIYGTAAARIHGCRVRGKSSGSTNAAIILAGGSSVTDTIAIHDGGIGINFNATTNNSAVVNCTVIGANTDFWGINGVATIAPLIINCNGTDGGRFWNNANSGTSDRPVYRMFNRTRNNTNADVGSADWPIYGAITADRGSDYVDLSGKTDYRLVNTSPALGAAQPGWKDTGALQRKPAGMFIG